VPTQTFAVQKMFRPRWPVIAVIAVVLFGGLLWGIFRVTDGAVVPSSCIWAAAIAFWVMIISMSTERSRTVSVADGVVVASWRRVPIRPSEVRIGRWVQMSLDTPVGLVAHVRGPGGSLRIGAREAGFDAYRLDGPRAQLVDCHLPPTDFDTLVAALGVRSGPVPDGMIFELVRPRRALRTLAPWVIAMIAASAAGVGLPAFALPQKAITAVITAIAFTGVIATMLDWVRIRQPSHELRIGPGGFALARTQGRPERVRATWPEVRAVRTAGVMHTKGGPYVYPTLEIALGVAAPIVVGAQDQSLAWTNPTEPGRRKPKWLVGSSEWPRLVQALESHGCFR
jgi:hypothetical protein